MQLFSHTNNKQSNVCGLFGIWVALLAGGLAFACPTRSEAVTSTLNVTNFGARGDAVQILAGTVSNSATITIQDTNRLSSTDAGKLILLFGVGKPTNPTNNQDMVAQIVSVSAGTNVVISAAAGRSAVQVSGIYGTQNAQPIQSCVDACSGTNTTVLVPAGRYLMVPPVMLDTNFIATSDFEAHTAVTIQKGGIHFLGASRDSSVLIGCGAWMLKGSALQRGFLFFTQGPVTNDAPLIFENLTMDGGVANGAQSYRGWPARGTDGAGWDVTHGAVLDTGSPPFHQNKQFINCRVTHWRGEMFKSVVGQVGQDGFIGITNCLFDDGNASAMNFSFTHRISNCTFSNLDMAMEFWEGYCFSNCTFESSIVTNARAGLIIVGALTNHVQPSYTIQNNNIQVTSYGIDLSPAQNVIVNGNNFHDLAEPMLLGGAGGQGSGSISNIVFINNVCTNAGQMLLFYAGSHVFATNNVLNGGLPFSEFANGGGSGQTYFYNNHVVNGRGGVNFDANSIQFPLDDISNQFPPHSYNDYFGVINVISYSWGARHLINDVRPHSVFVIDDTHPQQIPPGAVLVITSTCRYTVPLYFSAAMSGPPQLVSAGTEVDLQWTTNAGWQLSSVPAPPNNIRVVSGGP